MDLKYVNVPADTGQMPPGQDNEFFPDYLIRRDDFGFHSIPDRLFKKNLETETGVGLRLSMPASSQTSLQPVNPFSSC